ncbi:voltage-gated potassium channel [Rubritalea squalenifaciens DSM 18772]|uniref:Voltage-gated potassium channel n=1 Tax=Rubritalea squalenifaciens DSM 18772 TaxID=1123071 RepID=A0A1M6JG11_9BACT|nr:ion transporter [Rubritalea squalenifaciens]SHJ45610.1 voltage-gated potassium channel [Rubritalea squalenifaciens DSM 18772]
MAEDEQTKQAKTLKQRVWEIIFEAETPAGKLFDIVLLCFIGMSVLAVMLETVAEFKDKYSSELLFVEWFFTIMFSAEYLLRLWCSRKPLRYATSFFGVVDLLSCLPTYITLFLAGTSGFAVVRVLRLLRMFRVLKMAHHVRGAHVIMQGLVRSRAKITVFFFAILMFAVIAGTVMYYIEGNVEGTSFTSIPMSIYYAIVSITTVGYGDVVVQTNLGIFVTTIMILTGYAVIAVPTGIVTTELMRGKDNESDHTTDACPSCGAHGHLADAVYCRRCGDRLDHD